MSDSTGNGTGDLDKGLRVYSDTWLERNRRKERRTCYLGWFIALGFVLTIAGIVVVLLWLLKVSPFD